MHNNLKLAVLSLLAASASAACGKPGEWFGGQLGDDIDEYVKNSAMGSSVDLTQDGKVMIAGAPGKSQVKVFDYSGGSWNQRGAAIMGAAADKMGTSVAISEFNGHRIAIGGGPNADGIKVYSRSGDLYKQVGATIKFRDGANVIALSGEGDRLLVGAPSASSWGVYDLEDVSSQSGAKWKYQGGTGYKGSGYGFDVAISKDGSRVAISNGKTEVDVRDWDPKGCYGGTGGCFVSIGSVPGRYISLSPSGKFLAVTTEENKRVVKTYEYKKNTWKQYGGTIQDGNSLSDEGRIKISDYGRLAVGSTSNNRVNVYDFKGGSWALLDDSMIMNGLGKAIALSDNGKVLAVGVPQHRGARGKVRAYDLDCKAPAPPAPVCNDDPDWHYMSLKGERIGCEKIGGSNPVKCWTRMSHDGVLARDGCPNSCNYCGKCEDLPKNKWKWSSDGKSGCKKFSKNKYTKFAGCQYFSTGGVPATSGCPVLCDTCPASTQLAAKLSDEDASEDAVAVRVPTLVAICVMAGIALGGLATLLASKTSEPAEEAAPLLATDKL